MFERNIMATHAHAIKQLTSADYLLIEKEHKLLEKFLSDLENACACSKLDKLECQEKCGNEKEASCQGRLPSFLFYAIDIASAHFDHEEKIMLSRPHVTEEYKYFRLHHQAHEDILQNLNILVEQYLSLENLSNMADVYREFHKKLSNIFEEHDQLFDDPFIESTQF